MKRTVYIVLTEAPNKWQRLYQDDKKNLFIRSEGKWLCINDLPCAKNWQLWKGSLKGVN